LEHIAVFEARGASARILSDAFGLPYKFCLGLQTVVPFAGTTVFLLLFRCPREKGPVKKKGGKLGLEYVVLERT